MADRLARGSAVPAGTDPSEREETAKRPGSRERGALRRRLRQRRKLRDALLIELGALVMEAHRHGRDDAAVVKSKAAEAAAVDAETVALAEALGEGGDAARLTATGLAVPCPACGTLVAARARFCERCGAGLAARPATEPEAESADAMAVETASADSVAIDAGAEHSGTLDADHAAPADRDAPAPNGDGSERMAAPEHEATR